MQELTTCLPIVDQVLQLLSAIQPPNRSPLPDWSLQLIDKLTPTLVGAIISTVVAFALLRINARRERRKSSLDLYKEYFSAAFAQERYNAELFFEHHPDEDWNSVDPYDVEGPAEERTGYGGVTRFLARLSVLYKEKEIDRRLTERLLSRVVGYWYGLVYEKMKLRKTMYTRDAIMYLVAAMERGSRSDEFQAGYRTGVDRGAANSRRRAEASKDARSPGPDTRVSP